MLGHHREPFWSRALKRRHQLAARPDPVRRRMRPMPARPPLREQTRSPRLFSLRSDPVGRRTLAEQLGIDPDHPDSFAFLANGQAYVKSEAALRIARELPRWQWTWIFQFIPRVIRDAIYDLVARNRYRWFGRRDACILPNSDRSWSS